ncbi:MAG: hypothetical protein AB8B94_05835 [Hyphomicrobiales bacterium]
MYELQGSGWQRMAKFGFGENKIGSSAGNATPTPVLTLAKTLLDRSLQWNKYE